MARAVLPTRYVKAVFIRELRDGKYIYRREQYNIVTLLWGDGTENQSYIQPTGGCPISRSSQNAPVPEIREMYDEIEILDGQPIWATRVGTD